MSPLFGFIAFVAFWGAVAATARHMYKSSHHFQSRKLARQFRKEQAYRAAAKWWNTYEDDQREERRKVQ